MKRTDRINQLIIGFHDVQRAVLRHKENQTHGIPFGQKTVLFTIASREKTNIKEISTVLQITSGAATQHVEALVREGMVSRTVDENDRRTVVITLTEEGQALFRQLQKERLAKVSEFFADVSDEELDVFIEVIQKVKERIHP
ncbi:MarR family transcriptional regulator [Candidatus Saccharibacteria bacterium]|nr:MarR family transcriptional regulator [Candidatus Saccharibacteria bacterium]